MCRAVSHCDPTQVGVANRRTWREQLFIENTRLMMKLSEFETDVVKLLRQTRESLAELSTSLSIWNDIEAGGVVNALDSPTDGNHDCIKPRPI